MKHIVWGAALMVAVVGVAAAGAALVAARAGEDAGEKAGEKSAGPFAPSRLGTSTGEPVEDDWGYASEDCGACHPVQYEDWKGSMHSRAHHDELYLAFAHKAREEDPALYRFCSSCHAAAAVASGEIPGGKGREVTHHTDDGVSCVVCHAAKSMTQVHDGAGANASLVLDTGETMFGPIADPSKNPAHGSEESALHRKADFCSNCHTLIHPTNGLVIENTFEEWKQGPYAAAGVQCQDCHMRTVDEALQVAEAMKPIQVAGRTTNGPEERPDTHAHRFIGANVNEITGADASHRSDAEKRLKNAASIALTLPAAAVAAGEPTAIEVAVTNRSAGHAIPTSITELRQVWIDLRVTDAAGAEVFRSGAVDDAGRVDPQAVMYHSVLADEKGAVTFLPWRAVKMLSEKLIPPKETVHERYAVTLPADAQGPFRVVAKLLYRSAPQDVLDELFGQGKIPVRTVEMAAADGSLPGR